MKPNHILIVTIFLSVCLHLSAQTINTQFGQIQGTQNGNVYEFLGIPYAKPPVDTLRWKAPLNPDAWTGILTTTSFAPVCPQKRYEQGDTTTIVEGDEDCLYLNVWTPQTGTGDLAVMVFIHGGGNQEGGASKIAYGTQMFYGKNLSERGNVVVVTIQYRLGPLGFLVHPGLDAENPLGTSGNYAVMDQILALQWVHNNIANFGGNPNKVMIFGESAGGVDVGNLLVSPSASGLFERACIQSAAPVINDYTDSENKGIAFVNGFTSVGTDAQKIAFMRTVPPYQLVESLTNPLAGGVAQMAWQPVVDQEIFPNFPYLSVQSGNYNKVPLLIGSNADEMSTSVTKIVTPLMVVALINSLVPQEYRSLALQLYPPGNNSIQARQSYVQILTDSQFTAATRRTALCVSQNQTQDVWRYLLTFKHTIPAMALFGSYHGMELLYVFNNWENTNIATGFLFSPQDDSLQKVMLNYWTNFAKTGDPNGIGFPVWPKSVTATDCYLEIKATPNGGNCGLRTAQSDLWDVVSGFVPCTTSTGLDESSKNSIAAYPNPTTGNFSICPIFADQKPDVHLYDFTGKLVLSTRYSTKIDITDLPTGIYMLKISSKEQILCTKIVKQ